MVAMMWGEASLSSLASESSLSTNNAVKAWQGDALAQFLQHGFPTRKQEAWKYIAVGELEKQHFQLLGTQINHPQIENNQLPRSYQVVFVNGHWQPALSTLDNLPAGVVIDSIQQAFNHPDYFACMVDQQLPHTVFSQLNTALINDGVFIYIPPEVELDRPIHLLYYNQAQSDAHMNHPRHFIYVDHHAKVSVFEQYVGVGDGVYFNNIVSQIVTQPHARLTHYKLQAEAVNAYHIAKTMVIQRQNSQVNTLHFSAGAQLAREDLDFLLIEAHAQCCSDGFYQARAKQTLDTHSQIRHQASDTKSQQYYKTIATDQGRTVFNGKVIVAKGTQRVCAQQSNPNLLLSAGAEVDSKPELQIYSDDVSCSHGATIGELDEQALFYMQSRGIDRQQAILLLTSAFADEVINRIPCESIRRLVKNTFLQRELSCK